MNKKMAFVFSAILAGGFFGTSKCPGSDGWRWSSDKAKAAVDGGDNRAAVYAMWDAAYALAGTGFDIFEAISGYGQITTVESSKGLFGTAKKRWKYKTIDDAIAALRSQWANRGLEGLAKAIDHYGSIYWTSILEAVTTEGMVSEIRHRSRLRMDLIKEQTKLRSQIAQLHAAVSAARDRQQLLEEELQREKERVGVWHERFLAKVNRDLNPDLAASVTRLFQSAGVGEHVNLGFEEWRRAMRSSLGHGAFSGNLGVDAGQAGGGTSFRPPAASSVEPVSASPSQSSSVGGAYGGGQGSQGLSSSQLSFSVFSDDDG